jgi:hypothetical protein
MSDVYVQSVATHIHLSLVGHASPRWRSASGGGADKLNLELSRRRTQAVKLFLESAFRSSLPDAKLVFVYNTEYPDARAAGGDHQLDTESHGSSDTLHQARGDRQSNDPAYRRVDVSARLTHMVDGAAPSSRSFLVPVSQSTRRWAIQVGVGTNVHVVAGASFAEIRLKNRDTGAVAHGYLSAFGGGVGPKWKPLGASVSWGDYTPFTTDRDMDHNEFDGKGVRLTSASIGILAVGYEWTYLTIYGVGGAAHSMSVGGVNMGALAASAFTDHGNMWVPTSPRQWKRVDKTEWDRYAYDHALDFGHVVNFDTESSAITGSESAMLKGWVAEVARDFRSP